MSVQLCTTTIGPKPIMYRYQVQIPTFIKKGVRATQIRCPKSPIVSLTEWQSEAYTGPILIKFKDKQPCRQRSSVVVFGAMPIFLLCNIGSIMIFTILGTVLASEPISTK